jgi:DNA recombination protein RmuC
VGKMVERSARDVHHDGMNPNLYGVLGLIIGVLVGWLLRAIKRTPPDTRMEVELRVQRTAQESELARVRGELGQATEKCARLETANGNLTEQLGNERKQIGDLQTQFRTDFEAVANKVLLDNTARFSEQSSAGLEKLLSPLKENLGELKSSLERTRTTTETQSTLLKDQIERIGTEAANLSKALKGDVKVLGNWGENMLDQILEKSGLQCGLHYRRQQGAKNENGNQLFLDVIVDLPDKRNLVIDSKVSLRSYEESVNCTDDVMRSTHLKAHVTAFRAHFRGLGAKRYQDTHGICAPDFVLMYIPIEGAFFTAMAEEPGLFSEALTQDVVLITNSTLLATLRTVAHVWGLAEQQKNANEIAERGGKLYDKFVGFVEDLEDVKKALGNAQDALGAATSKLETGSGNLVRQAQQLKDLKVKATKSLPSALLERAADNERNPTVLLAAPQIREQGL